MAVTTTQEREPFLPEWSLGDRLAKVRAILGLKQTEMAELLNVSDGAVAQWERDISKPRDLVGTIERYSEVSGVSAAWLLGLTVGNPFGEPDLPERELVSIGA